MKKQILLIHGGSPFDSYEDYLGNLKKMEVSPEKIRSSMNRWNRKLDVLLGDDFDVIMPQMPCKQNSKYLEWEIFFEKLFPFLYDEIIFIGHSLGGIFLAKYLAENNFPKKIKAVFLVAAPFEGNNLDESLGDFILPESLEKMEKQVENIFIVNSKDDPFVPFSHQEKYAQKLPRAEKIIFEDKGHFSQEQFPEIVEKIMAL